MSQSHKKQRIQVFNKMLLDTISFLINKFPTDRDFSFTKSQIELSISTFPEVPFNTVMEYIPLYTTEITNQDENFFLSLSKTNDSLKCFNLHDKWSQLTSQEKEYMFVQFRKMLTLGNIINTL